MKKRKDKVIVRPPTYAAKPFFGGRFEDAEPLDGTWWWKPKWNGRRLIFHVPSERTWNKEGNEVNWRSYPAFHKLALLIGLHWPSFEWLDIEFLYGRHSMGKGAIIVLDVINEKPWGERQADLATLFGDKELKFFIAPLKHEIYYGPHLKTNDPLKAWLAMQEFNKTWDLVFYEGLVGYEISKPYPIQLFSHDRVTPTWVKYRFPLKT